MNRKTVYIGAGVALALLMILIAEIAIIGAVVFSSGAGGGGRFASLFGERIALVRVEGVIYEGEDLIEEIKGYEDDQRIKALVLRIDSPGGSVAASQEVYEALNRFRATGRPVVADFANVSASGGYYIACASDWIVANPGTVTGSIGTILEGYSVYEGLDRLGLGIFTVQSDELKDIGSPFRPMTPADRAVLQDLVDNTYEQFLAAVTESRLDDVMLVRQIETEEEAAAYIRSIADGRVISGEQAFRMGLVDELGDLHRAVQMAAELAGIEGEPVVVEKIVEQWNLSRVLGFAFPDRTEALAAFAGRYRPGLHYLMLW